MNFQAFIFNMIDSEELRFHCIRCGNCCLDKNTLVNVTYQDILRIVNGLKLDLEEINEIIGFYIFDQPPNKKELEKMVVPPIETENGKAFVGLKKKSSGACYFYDNKNGCKIYNLRPMFCRTFPFSFKIVMNEANKSRTKIEIYYTDKSVKYCPGIGKDAPVTNKDDWITIGKKTIEEMSRNNVLIKKWNDAIKSKKIFPSAKSFLRSVLNLRDVE